MKKFKLASRLKDKILTAIHNLKNKFKKHPKPGDPDYVPLHKRNKDVTPPGHR